MRIAAKLCAALAMAAVAAPAAAGELGELRDEAICNIGWAAGNSYGHPVWPQVKPWIGRGGDYYEFLLTLKEPGMPDDVTAALNVKTYERCKEKGSRVPFDEDANVARIRRVQTILDEMSEVMKRMK